jgi:hypothetical protein
MSRADEVRELRGQGLSSRRIAAELGISQTRVCQLLSTVQPVVPANTVQPDSPLNSTHPNTVQPDSPLNSTHPNTVQPVVLDEAAIRADERAILNARIKPHWDAAQAEIAALRAQLAAGAPGPGSCPAHHIALVAACPRCTPLEDS